MLYNSHPNKTLVKHLTEVRDYSIRYVPKEYKDAYEIIALCHDFGKYTSYFQQYLKNKKKSSLSNHGFISAVFGAYLGLKHFGEGSILPLMIYNVIIHHHGSLESFSENLPTSFKNPSKESFPPNVLEKVNIGYAQIEDMKSNVDNIIVDISKLGMKQEFIEFINTPGIIEDILCKLTI